MKRISILFIFAFIFTQSLCAKTRYVIDSHIDYEKHVISSTVKINFKNTSKSDLEALYLMLYPNSHLEKEKYLDDVSYVWFYPDNFNKGLIDIKKVGYHGKNLEIRLLKNKKTQKSIVLEVRLPEKLKSNQSIELEISCDVLIPKKFGSFGYYRKQIIINGGYYPYLAPLDKEGNWLLESYPQEARFEVSLSGKGDFVINGKKVQGKEGVYRAGFENADYITFINAPKLVLREIKGKNGKISFFNKKGEGTINKYVTLLCAKLIDFLESREEFKSHRYDISLARAYFRDRLIQPSDGVVYFSDRSFKVIAALRGYHSIEITRGLIYQFLRELIRKRESVQTYDWVTNTLAWYYTEQFIKYDLQKMTRDARKLKAVRVFSFIPQIDQVLYAPQFSFENVFYDKIYSYDIFGQDILDFNNSIQSKRVVYEKIKDKYSSRQNLAEYYVSYIKGDKPFTEHSVQYFDEEISKIFAHWLGPYPRINYELGKTTKTKLKNGSYESTIEINKTEKTDFEEPVKVYVEEWKGKKHLLEWDGRGDRKEFKLYTDERIRTVHVNPSGRLFEMKQGDNRYPELYKWVFTGYNLSFDFNAKSLIIDISTQFRKIYGSRNRYRISGFRDNENYGAGFGYTRLFGRLLDSLRMSHGLGVTYSINGIPSDYVIRVFTQDDPLEQYQDIPINKKGMNTSLLLQYFFGNQISFMNPKSGMTAIFYGELASSYLGGDFGYYRAGMSVTGVYPFDQNHLLALRGLFGISGRNGIPAQSQFHLAGISTMKGFYFSDIEKIGRNRLLLSAEYRHYLFKDIDINLLWSAIRVRNILGVLSANTGRVSASVAEYARSKAGLASFNESPHHLFNVKKYDADFGYGIRILYDIFGVRESILAIDVAKSATEFHDNAVRYYIAFQQTF